MSAPTAGPDAELMAACREFLAMDAEMQRLDKTKGKPDGAMDALWDRYYPPLERLTALPARTLEGRRMKADAAYAAISSVVDDDGCHREEMAAMSALRDILGRAE